MRRWFPFVFLALFSSATRAAAPDLVCNRDALTRDERARHVALTQELLRAVQQERELPRGYALRLPAERWLDAARWVADERRCCAFFAFELASAPGAASVWLTITGKPGTKAFLRAELGKP